MPIYEYVCQKCSERFSLLQNIHASEKDTECPKCLSHDVKKALSSFACGLSSGGGISSPVPSGGFGGGGG